mgnify:FL=1
MGINIKFAPIAIIEPQIDFNEILTIFQLICLHLKAIRDFLADIIFYTNTITKKIIIIFVTVDTSSTKK